MPREHITAGRVADGDLRHRFPENLSPSTVSLGLLCPCQELPAPGLLAKYLPLANGQCRGFGGFLTLCPGQGLEEPWYRSIHWLLNCKFEGTPPTSPTSLYTLPPNAVFVFKQDWLPG